VGLAFLLFPSSFGLAQTQLPGIYVKGATLEKPPRASPAPEAPATTETEDGSADGGVPAASVGNAVTVITRKDLERQQVRHVADALRSVPGVAVSRSGAFGNFTQVRIRGAEGNHTLVLIDGVEANNTTDGEFDFSNLAAEDIERIEVIRGPMSALYGSSAVGGVINIITRRGQGPLTLTLKTEVGSLGTSDVAARLAAGGPWTHFALGAHWRNADGFNISPFGSEADGMLLKSLSFTGGVKVMEGLGLEVHLRQVDKRADRDGFDLVSGSLLTAKDDPLPSLHDRLFLGGARLQWETLNKQLTHQLHFKYHNSTTSDADFAFGPPAFLTTNESERTTYGYLGTYRFDTAGLWAKHALSALIEKEVETFVPGGTLGDGIKRERERLAFAGEWRGGFAEQIFITAGVRHDDNSVFSDFTTWRLAGAWALKPLGLRPHASVGTAVKFPQMFEQFGAFPLFFVANPNLQPEESFGWDAGVEWTLNRNIVLDLAYFHADLTNKIANSGLPPPNNPTLINIPGSATRDGIELALRTRWSPALTGIFAYTYLLSEDAAGVQEIRRPRHAGRIDVVYVFGGGKGSANLGVVYNGAMTDNAFKSDFSLQSVLLDDYWLVNAALSYKLQPGVELFGRVENLFDQRYQEVFGFQAAPIMAFAGFKLTFGGRDGIDGTSTK
jgi:vitamin B12 transporter